MATPQQSLWMQAAIFDLDGVVTRTASLHAASWKRMFDDVLAQRAEASGTEFVPFTIEGDYRQYVDGRPRIDGVTAFLHSRQIDLPLGEASDEPGFDTAWALGNLKNRGFNELVLEQGVEIMDGTVALIRRLRSEGIRVGVASSSKNCAFILESAGLEDLFETRVDGVVSAELGLSGKPAPDIFLEAAKRLGADPACSMVVEDATSGVRAGRDGGFGLVVGIGPEASRLDLREHGADWIVESFDEASYDRVEAWFAHRKDRLPSALGDWEGFLADLNGRKVALFLDYDGTLTPIRPRPELATLDPAVREALRALSKAIPAAIISGRGRPDVQRLVDIPELAYAGSHGFDIIGPNGRDVEYEIAEWIEPLIEHASEWLRSRLGVIQGCIIEPKGFSVAAHYRLVAEDRVAEVESAVDELVATDERLTKAVGKKVFEVRPALDWDKGKALLVLLEALELDSDDTVPIYIGDDVTDEDAFRVLCDRGVGILVSETPRASSAGFWLQDPFEVMALLDRLRDCVEGSEP